MFNSHQFRFPGAVNAPGYFWFLNAGLDEEELRRQLRDMAEAGARSVCPHPFPREFRDYFMASLEPGYLTPEYFKMFEIIADECAKLGLNCYLYDEGGWPSGGACGQVYASDPERFGRRFIVSDGPGKYKIKREESHPDVMRTLPDVLARGATEKFLELTHDGYFRRIGKHFGKTFRFAFMDEPTMPNSGVDRLTWTEDLFDEFRRRKGYNIEPLLAEMLEFANTSEVIQARIDFHDVVSQLFIERFMLPIRDWCRKHGLLSGGHFGGEDNLRTSAFNGYGHILRSLRAMDFPGVDVIWRQLWPGERLHPFPKFASSVARQGGHRFVSGEMFGVYGSGLTFREMKFLIDYMLVCGVNTFVACARPYSTRGGLIEGERPHFGPMNPQWWIIRPFHEYIGRNSMLSTSGRPAVDTAVFYDVRSLWAEPRIADYAAEAQVKIADRLLEQQSDFDYVDDDALAAAKVRNGRLKIGRATYTRLVVPVGARMAPEAEARLKKLAAAGIQVLNSDRTAEVPPTLAVEPREWRLRVRKTALRGGNALYFVLNTSDSEVTATLRAEEKAPVARCDAERGRIFAATASGGVWQWTFGAYGAEVFLVGPGAAKAEPPLPGPGRTVFALSGPWRLRPVRRTVVGADDYKVEKMIRRPAVPAKLGDWRGILGEEFSGEAVYTAEFDGSSLAGAAFLDLGDVRYAATVRLNGRKLGTRLYAPYVFELSDAGRPGRNRLEVAVVNTLANAIAPEAVWKKWRRELPFECPYEKLQRRYERESLVSGLFGPVEFKASECKPGEVR